MSKKKQERVLEIADELDLLSEKYHDPSLKEVAVLLRKSLPSEKSSSNESTSDEGGEGDGEDGGGNGGNHPGKKPGN